MKIFKAILILSLVIFVSNCKNKSHKKNQVSIVPVESELMLYFKKNNWQFPIQVDTSRMKVILSNETQQGNVIFSIQGKLYEWCISDSIIFKHHANQAIRIHEIVVNEIDKSRFQIMCMIDFYENGEIRNGTVLPVEGHSIIENKFLRQREIAVLMLNHDTLTFSNWKQ